MRGIVGAIPCGRPCGGAEVNAYGDRPYYIRMEQLGKPVYSRGDPLRSPWMRVHSSISFIRQQSRDRIGSRMRGRISSKAVNPPPVRASLSDWTTSIRGAASTAGRIYAGDLRVMLIIS